MTTPQWTYRGTVNGVSFPTQVHTRVALGDLDGDGDLDMVGSSDAPAIRCWENVGTPQVFQFVENPAMLMGVEQVPGGCYGLELVDIDGDGDPDMIIADPLRGGESYLYLNERISPVERTTWSSIKALYR